MALVELKSATGGLNHLRIFMQTWGTLLMEDQSTELTTTETMSQEIADGQQLSSNKITPEEIFQINNQIKMITPRLKKIEKEIEIRGARENFLSFIKYTKPDYRVGWHNELICKYLDKFVSGEIKNLMIFCPPRHGKSEAVSRRLPAYLLGKKPDSQIISCSYSSDLASMFNRDTQRVIDSPEYVKLFPGTKLNSSNVRSNGQGQAVRNSDQFEIVGRRGFYKSAGVGGGITGMGANFAILDDILRNMQDANSPTIRQNIWEWYCSVLFTRLMGERQILITLTRWHEDDLAGRLLRQAKDDPRAVQWEVLSLPAKYEIENAHPDDPRKEGEALWSPDFGDEVLNKIKSSVGSRVWTSLYQQRPAPDEGNIVKTEWWKFWTEETLPTEWDEVVQSWDLTFKDKEQSDFVAGQVWARSGADKFLLYRVKKRMGFNEQVLEIIRTKQMFPNTTAIYVEDAATASAVKDVLQSKIPGIVLVPTEGNSKLNRAIAVSPQIEAGNVYLPSPSTNPSISDYIEEWANFPNGVNDDEVDATTQALRKLGEQINFDWAPVSLVKQSIWGGF